MPRRKRLPRRTNQKFLNQKHRQMIVTEIEPYKKNRYKVCMDDGTYLILYKGETRHYKIKAGCEIPQDTYDEIFCEVLGKRVKKRAMGLLEKMDRTEKGLRDKLREGDYPEQLIEDAVTYVKDYHYIDDERYAKNYISYRKSTKSRMNLKQALLRKGVKKEIIDRALEEEYTESEDDKIILLLKKKNYNPVEQDRKEQARIYGFLMRRGFRSEDILRVMKCTDYLT